MKVELLQPAHVQGIIATPVELAPGQSKVLIKLKFGKSPGPFNATFKIRASTTEGKRRIGEAVIEFVLPVE